MKLTLTEKVERELLKFSKSLKNSLITKNGQNREDLHLINSKSLQASMIVTEEMLYKYLINSSYCTLTIFTYFLRMFRNEFMHERIDNDNGDLLVLTKDLGSNVLKTMLIKMMEIMHL